MPLSAGGLRSISGAQQRDRPNTTGAEFSPSLVTTAEGTHLYFSSTVSGNHDIYRSRMRYDGTFEPPTPVSELNTEFDDRMPNVQSDGLEVVFSSTRPSDADGEATFGSFDVYVSRRPNATPVVGTNQSRRKRQHRRKRNARDDFLGRQAAVTSAATATYSSSRTRVPGWD